MSKKDVFIIGSKGIPASYGGFETFVDELVSRQKDDNIKYHIACMSEKKHRHDTRYYGARCFHVYTPNIGAAKALIYDIKALKSVYVYAQKNNIANATLYVLACRIGPIFKHYVKKLHKLNFKIYVNPDGHEWLRSKWTYVIKKYWKLSERLMVKNADLIICDSKNIEKYIRKEYDKYQPKTIFIPYGADTKKSALKSDDGELIKWQKKHMVQPMAYYLVVGRFVPENNYKMIIKGFMESDSEKDLIIITNMEENTFYNKLLMQMNFDKDRRIKFVGTVYNKDLLKKIREDAFAYIHGHSVGGTNPSLLEALATTKVNILYDCVFNREVAENGAMYFGDSETLEKKVLQTDALGEDAKEKLSGIAKERISKHYDWGKIVYKYEEVFNA